MAVEQAYHPPPLALGGSRIVAVPSQFYTTGEDYLYVASFSSVPNVVVEIDARIVRETGPVNSERWTHRPNGNRTPTIDVFDLGVGALLNLAVFVASGTLLNSQCWMYVGLVRGKSVNGQTVATLLSGQITSWNALGWPGSPITRSVEGLGAIRYIFGTQPAAGLEFIETVPTNARWELLTFACPFTTSAVVGSRVPRLTVSAAGIIPAVLATAAAQSENQAAIYTWAQGNPPLKEGTSQTFQGPLPVGIALPAGTTIQSSTFGLGVADQWGQPRYAVKEWIEAP